MKGLFLVLEGGDGAGKSSQLALLEGFFKKSGRTVQSVHFPRLEAKPYGQMIGEFLRGEYGSIETVHPKLTALLYALDRQQAAPALRETIAAGRVLLADRYIFSNIAYQCAKLDDSREREVLSDWIEVLEYGSHGIPRPDLTLYLDVPPEFSRAKLAERQIKAGPTGGRDIHEASNSLQDKVREVFLGLTKARSGEVGLVDCRAGGGGIADRATIHSRIVDALRYYGII